jgi:hypothetical protein
MKKSSSPLVAVAVVIVLFLVMARVQGIRLDAESRHEAFSNHMVRVSNRHSHAHFVVCTLYYTQCIDSFRCSLTVVRS